MRSGEWHPTTKGSRLRFSHNLGAGSSSADQIRCHAPAVLMNLSPTLLLAPAALSPLLPLVIDGNHRVDAAGLSSDQVSSISQFSDVRPSDWAYQALSNLIEGHGCVAGYANSSYAGGRPLSRYEAAALINACLDRVSEQSEALQRLLKEFERELAALRGRVDGLEARVGELEATQFSTTTKLNGEANFVVGGNAFSGSASTLVHESQERFGAISFNYDLKLNLDTSFTGRDLLRTTLRAGNFSSIYNSFGGGGPSPLSTLEVAFQEDFDSPDADGGDVIGINRLFYQLPLGDFTLTLGGLVEQGDMLAISPSVYPSDTVLDVLALPGAQGAYNMNLGTGAGLWWQKNGFAISANYVAANGQIATPQAGGIATSGSGGAGTVQAGYSGRNWAVAGIFSYVQNDNDVIVYATDLVATSFNNPGNTTALGLSGYWQPLHAGWIPSISAGWGYNSSTYAADVANAGLVATSQSWSVGLEWQNVLRKSNALGMAVGEATFATSLYGGATPQDGNLMWEWWYKVQLSDAITLTPALFYLNRPLGENTPSGRSFNQLGALIKTSFQF
ncbi:MAG: hypothetical protein RLZZ516_302 [Cyanobacteriota bacterium]|jgi:hypothetical protein